VGASWQWIVIVAIEIAAIVFLARRMFGRDGAKKPTRRGPDVPVRSLVRKK
jgi:hypothetical protein